jgi:hypothetical protein
MITTLKTSRVSTFILVLCLFSFCPAPVSGKTVHREPPTDDQSVPSITVRALNSAGVPKNVLAQAQSVARSIFRKAGLAIEWVNCPDSSEGGAGPDACRRPTSANEFFLRILPTQKDALPGFGDDAGCAFLLLQADKPSYLTTVYYNAVTKMAGLRRDEMQVPPGVILGHAAAHEIGHLLLRTPTHSSIGLMRAQWMLEDLDHAAQGTLIFTPEQAAQMRAEAQSRAVRETAAAVAVEAPPESLDALGSALN